MSTTSGPSAVRAPTHTHILLLALIFALWLAAGALTGLLVDRYTDTTPAPDEPAPEAPTTASTYEFEDQTGDARLTRTLGFRKGPYLQNVTRTGITICWESTEPSTGEVRYGLTDALGSNRSSTASVTYHEVRLDGLEPNTHYSYQVSIGGVLSTLSTFRTAPERWDSFRVLFYGDSRSNPGVHSTICTAILGEQPLPRLVFNTGDLVHDGHEDGEWDEMHFTPAASLMQQIPMYPSLGNHEHHADQYYKYFQLPGPNGEERWYSFDYGNVHFIGFSSEDAYLPGSDQYAWLEADVQAAEAAGRWIVAYWHRPPYNTGVSHGTGNPLDDPEATDMRNTVCTLLEDAGAKLIFHGHEHFYEHAVVNDANYIITGGGGAYLSYYGGPASWQITAQDRSFHYVVLDFSPFECTITATRHDGTIIETFTESIPVIDYPPQPIEALTANDTANDNGGAITLTWTPSADDDAADQSNGWGDVSGYTIERAGAAAGPFDAIATLPPGSDRYTDTDVEDATAYWYRVVTLDASGSNRSAPVGPVLAEDNVRPGAPTDVTASDTPGDNGGSIDIAWTLPTAPDLETLLLLRAQSAGALGPGTTPLAELAPDRTAYTDTNVTDATDYYYALVATDGVFYSPLSAIAGPARAQWDGAPSPPRITSVQDESSPGTGTLQLRLVWTRSVDDGDHPGADVVEYRILRASALTQAYARVATVPAGTTEWVDTNLTGDTDYYYLVRAFDGGLESANSNILGPVCITVTPSAPVALKAHALDATQIELTWEPNLDALTVSYRCYLNASPSPAGLIGTIDQRTETDRLAFVATDLEPGTRYTFALTAVSGYGPESSASTVTETTLAPPRILSIVFDPNPVANDGNTARLTTTVRDGTGAIGGVRFVMASCTPLGLGPQAACYDDGSNGDTTAGDGVFTCSVPVATTVPPGMYTITITATDYRGLIGSASASVTVLDAAALVNQAPTITSATPSHSMLALNAGEAVAFSIAAADANGDPLQFAWYLNNTPVTDTGASGTTITFDRNGTFVVEVQVVDPAGALASRSWTVRVGAGSSDANDTIGDDGDGGGATDRGSEDRDRLIGILTGIVVAALGAASTVAIYLYRRRGNDQGR